MPADTVLEKDFSDTRRFEDRVKDLERRVHTLEDRHEDIVRTARADIESVRTIDGNPPPEDTASDREREAEERAATGRSHSDTRDPGVRDADRAKGGDHVTFGQKVPKK